MVALDREARAPARAERSHLHTIRTLLPYLWPRGSLEMRGRVVLAVILLVGAKVANVYVPILYKDAVDILSGDTTAVIVVPVAILLAYGALRVLTVAFGELRDAVFAKVGERAIRTVALQVFNHLHQLSLRYHIERRTGGLSRAIERGVKGIEFLLTFMLFNILPTLVEVTMVCGILWVLYGITYAAITFVTIGLFIAFTLTVTEWRLKYRRRMNEKDSEANTKAIDSLLNYETVKYFGNEMHEAQRFDVSRRQYERAAVQSKTSLSLLNIGQGVIIATGLTGITILAGYEVAAGTMTIGDFVLVNTYLLQLYIPLNFLGFVYREIKQSLTDMESMFVILSVEREIEDAADAPPLRVTAGAIEFEDVRFRYEERRGILDGISFQVRPGTTTAIVGASGAGKSTISRILFRFYDIEAGSVRIDGQDVRDVTQQSLRAAIGIVPQDTVLFNDTIFYNIAYGRPDATPEEVEEAARLAHIHDFVAALPDGYDSTVGERGLKLSGGEKQRVAIARTILKNPRILLFDEATSALDSQTEKEIQASLREVSRDRSTLMIAHRLSTVIDADQILVLDAGRIVERGQPCRAAGAGRPLRRHVVAPAGDRRAARRTRPTARRRGGPRRRGGASARREPATMTARGHGPGRVPPVADILAGERRALAAVITLIESTREEDRGTCREPAPGVAAARGQGRPPRHLGRAWRGQVDLHRGLRHPRHRGRPPARGARHRPLQRALRRLDPGRQDADGGACTERDELHPRLACGRHAGRRRPAHAGCDDCLRGGGLRPRDGRDRGRRPVRGRRRRHGGPLHAAGAARRRRRAAGHQAGRDGARRYRRRQQGRRRP